MEIPLPLVSVIVPVYNGELTIKETIKSVLNQSFQDFEIIVINDGSTDTTLDILSRFQDPRLKVFSYENAGLSASRNRGLSLAAGEFVSFIDADDLWTRDKLDAQVSALQSDPQYAVSYSWTQCIDSEGNPLDYGICTTQIGNVFPELLQYFFLGSGSNALVRKQVFDNVGTFDETLTSAEDWDMFLRIAAQYKFLAVPHPQILYRISDHSMSRNVLRQEKESLKVLDRAFSGEPGASFLHLKKNTYANLYIYLTTQALRGSADRKKGKIAARFLWISLKSNPLLFKQIKYVMILIFKIITAILLSPRVAQLIREKAKLIVKRSR